MSASINNIGRYGIFVVILGVFLAAWARPVQAAGKGGAEQIRIKTMDDLLKWGGVQDPDERQYVEDEMKQHLQDEISEIVDTKLDVVVYLQTIDHLAHGESKKANNFLAEEVLKKLLENLIGGPLMKALTAAWEFDKYVWGSVQAWAEQKDMELYQAFLREYTKQWGQDGEPWEADYRKEYKNAKYAFDQWWEDHANSFGRIKPYSERDDNPQQDPQNSKPPTYYETFRTDCWHHFSKAVKQHWQAKVAESDLKTAARSKRNQILQKLSGERDKYRNAVQMLLRAKQKGDMTALVKKYWSDPAFRKYVNDLAQKNSATFIEEEAGILQNAEGDLEMARMSASKAAEAMKAMKANQSGKVDIPIIHIDLEPYHHLLRDYQSLTAEIFSDKLDDLVTGDDADDTISAAVSAWYHHYNLFNNNVLYVRNYYKDSLRLFRIGLSESQINSVEAEIKKIDAAVQAFNTALLAEKKEREQKAVNDMLSMQSQVKNLNRLAAQPMPISKQVRKEFADESTKLREELEKLAENASVGPLRSDVSKAHARYILAHSKFIVYKPPVEFVKSCVDPRTGMEQYSEFFEKYSAAHSDYLAKLQAKIPALLEESKALQEEKRAAVERLEASAKPMVPGWLYYYASASLPPRTGVKLPEEARLSGDLNVMPENWRRWLSKSNREATEAENYLSLKLQAANKQWFDILEYDMQMQDDFAQERRWYSQAQQLLATIQSLAEACSSEKQEQPEDRELYRDGLIFLRGLSAEREKLLLQMVSRNHAAVKLLNGALSGYRNALNPKNEASYRLDIDPYKAWRRSPEENAKLVKGMELVIERASSSGMTYDQAVSVRNKSNAIMVQLKDIRSTTILLSSLIDPIVDEAFRYHNAICAFVAKTDIVDIDAARKKFNSFKRFAAQASANYAADNRTMKGYLDQAKSLISAQPGSGKAGKAENLQRASRLLELAGQHTRAMELYALSKGSWRFDKQIQDLKKQIAEAGFIDEPPDHEPDSMAFDKAHVIVCGTDEVFVGSLYHSVFEHEPTSSEVQAQVRRLREGTLRSQLVRDFLLSAEYTRSGKSGEQFVTDACQAIFAREPTALERKAWPRTRRSVIINEMFKSREHLNATCGCAALWRKTPVSSRPPVDVTDNQNKQPTAGAAYQQYMSAYNALAKLMAAGKGGTPEGQKAYQKMKYYKDLYEASLGAGVGKLPDRPAGAEPPATPKKNLVVSPHYPVITTKPADHTDIRKDAQIIRIEPVADSYVYAYAYRNWNKSNRGAYNLLQAGWHPAGGVSRVYLKYDLSGINPNRIGKATLRLFHYRTGGHPALVLGIHAVTGTWREGSGTYHSGQDERSAAPGEITWVAQPPFNNSVVASFSPGAGTNKYIDVDVTDLVKGWLSGRPNYGLVITPRGAFSRGTSESVYGFYSREHGNKAKRPVLILQSAGGTDAPADPSRQNIPRKYNK
ncbi:MAG: DNRLRE domain-containing protein [Pirellulales bacterium]|nr:DNRLRE domain-containing protein [Pirellulales bacterium]